MDSHAQIIVDFMAEHGITQVEMAQRLQVTAATLSRWLSGSHGISETGGKDAFRLPSGIQAEEVHIQGGTQGQEQDIIPGKGDRGGRGENEGIRDGSGCS